MKVRILCTVYVLLCEDEQVIALDDTLPLRRYLGARVLSGDRMPQGAITAEVPTGLLPLST